jgi:predicted nucleic acid-binding protein
MLLDLLPSHSKVFCDANVLTYAFLGADETSQLCSALLKRSARREIELYTSSFQASHTIHRIMVREAMSVFGHELGRVVAFLKKHPDHVRSLTEYKRIPGEFSRARVRILDVTYRDIHASKQYRDDYGLLTDDSIMLAVMQRYDLVDLATNDEDFKRIPGLRLWMPD